MTPPRRIIVDKNGCEAPADLRVGERVVLVRGDGPREGQIMSWATVTGNDPEGGLTIDADGTGNAPEELAVPHG